MSTALQISPRDHGRSIALAEFMAGDFAPGSRYELVDGRLYVTPAANYPHAYIVRYVHRLLLAYSLRRPDVFNTVETHARVFVPGMQRATAIEPDLAVYRGLPAGANLNWQDISPLVVAEVMGGEDDDKDLVRNVELYWRVPSIQEYWIFDAREDADRPTLLMYRREQEQWAVATYPFGAVYTTPLLPEFSLPVDPQSEGA